MDNKVGDKTRIGARLKACRERAFVSVEEAAVAAAVQPLAVKRWERGAALPSLLELRDLLALYGVTSCEVLYDHNPMELSPEMAGELARAAKHFSPELRARVDCLLAMIARGREPTWLAGATPKG